MFCIQKLNKNKLRNWRYCLPVQKEKITHIQFQYILLCLWLILYPNAECRHLSTLHPIKLRKQTESQSEIECSFGIYILLFSLAVCNKVGSNLKNITASCYSLLSIAMLWQPIGDKSQYNSVSYSKTSMPGRCTCNMQCS